MRLGYKVIKQIDQRAQSSKKMSELESLEYMIYMSLKEDDPDLKQEQIEDMLDNADMEYVALKLEETVSRDMPGLGKKEAVPTLVSSNGEEPKN